MKPDKPFSPAPPDARERKSVEPVICYPVDTLPEFDPEPYQSARNSLKRIHSVTIAPRDAETFEVDAGQFFRISCPPPGPSSW